MTAPQSPYKNFHRDITRGNATEWRPLRYFCISNGV